MNLIDLTILATWFALIVTGLMMGAHRGGPLGAALGGGVAIAAPFIVSRLVSMVWRWTSGNRPRFPMCFNGGCNSDQYSIEIVDGQARYRCGCGDAYVFGDGSWNVTSFRRLTPDGAVPFMKHTTWSRWLPDADDP